MKNSCCLFLFAFVYLLGSPLHAGNLKVNLAPAQAVSAGAQWRVDSGTWRASGVTVSNLSNGNHTVSFKTVTGWIAPADIVVNVVTGTTTITGTYVAPASLKINLTPSAGRWRIDGGTWRTGGTTLFGLTPGSHNVDYQAVSGYVTPAAEAVNLLAGQTTTLSRSYAQFAQLTLVLTPSTGKWRVDGGTWRNSNTAATGLSPGPHTVTFAAVTGYANPPDETVTLAAGQALTLNRAYTALAKLAITLNPSTGKWRIDGGAWLASGTLTSNLTPGSHTVEYQALAGFSSPSTETVTLISGQTTNLSRAYVPVAQVTVNLTPSTGQWRIDGDTWRGSGTTATGLTPGSHALEFAALAGYSSPPPESITLAAGQSLGVTRNYTALASLRLTLAPAAGKWRVDGGAWLNSGALAANLTPGNHAVDYQALAGYNAPHSETVTLVSGQTTNLTRNYIQLAQVTINLVPLAGQWRVDGGTWQSSGTTLPILPGAHLVEYSTLENYDSPVAETVTLTAGGVLSETRSYLSQRSSLRVDLSPSNGQWRVDGGAWQSSNAVVTDLVAGDHAVEYVDLGGTYNPLSAETVSLALRQNAVLVRTYPLKPPAALTIVLEPNVAEWRVDNGAWQASGTTIGNLSYHETHLIEYASLAGYITPPATNLILASGELRTINVAYTPLASIHVSFLPAWLPGQWRIDGGAWRDADTTAYVAFDVAHTVEYSSHEGFVTPAPDSFTLSSGEARNLTPSYAPLASLGVTFDPSWIQAQWRVDAGPWRNAGTSTYVTPGAPHSVEYSIYDGYVAPATDTVTLGSGELRTLTATYSPLASLYVYFDPNWVQAQWRIDGGAWRDSSTTAYNLSYGVPHTIEYSDYNGYVTPASTTVTLNSGEMRSLTATYSLLASLYVYFDPNWIQAQWRIDGGAWRDGSTTAYNLSYGVPHTIEYSDYNGYVAPASTTVTLNSGEMRSLTATYSPLASLYVYFDPNWVQAQWRIDGGAWRDGSTTAYNLSYGVPHTIEYSDYNGYVAPSSTTVTLNSGEMRSLTATYSPLASLYVYFDPNWIQAQWRIDGGAWRDGSTTAYNLSYGVPHTIEYSDYSGYVAPSSTTVTLNSGEMRSITATYTALADMSVSLTPTFARWRLDGGKWNASYSLVYGLSLGTHTIEYSTHEGYLTPPSETVTLAAGYNNTLYRTYATDPAFVFNSSLATFSASLDPDYAEWRLDGGAWNVSGATLHNLAHGEHSIEYKDIEDYITPPPATVTLPAAPLYTSYVTLDPAQLTLTTNPASGQWRLYPYQTPAGGTWRASGSTAFALNPGQYQIEYSSLAGYASPALTFITLQPNDVQSLTATYSAQPVSFRIFLNPTTARFRIDGRNWLPSGGSLSGGTAGTNYLVEFEPVPGYVTPAAVNINLNPGESKTFTFTYTPL